jgi:hypothetical protein
MLIAAGLALVLAGCSSTPPGDLPPPPPSASQSPPPQAAAPARRPPPVAIRDSCGAAALQRLVGHPRTEIPVPLEPSRQRVACTTCPVTQDYSPGRLNFFFDADTGIIKQIRCG